jgi:predicted metalloprotease
MLWKGRERSGNVEDRRGMRPGGLMIGGGLGGLVLVVLFLVLGGDPRQLLQMQQQSTQQVAPGPGEAINDETSEFVSVVLKDTEDVWSELLGQSGQTYRPPHLTLFSARSNRRAGSPAPPSDPSIAPTMSASTSMPSSSATSSALADPGISPAPT